MGVEGRATGGGLLGSGGWWVSGAAGVSGPLGQWDVQRWNCLPWGDSTAVAQAWTEPRSGTAAGSVVMSSRPLPVTLLLVSTT